ncbi:MAG: hypothetical protein ABIQ12_13010 [Opitutaceae bacterium]
MRPFPLLAVLIAGSPATLATPNLLPFEPRRLTAAEVIARYGAPSQRIGADLWVYWDFPPASVAARRAGCDTLTVYVVGQEVRAIRLVNADALRALLRSVGDANRPAATASAPRP